MLSRSFTAEAASSGLDQPDADGATNQVGQAAGAQRLHQLLAMELDGLDADLEFVANLLGRSPFPDETKHFALPPRQLHGLTLGRGLHIRLDGVADDVLDGGQSLRLFEPFELPVQARRQVHLHRNLINTLELANSLFHFVVPFLYQGFLSFHSSTELIAFPDGAGQSQPDFFPHACEYSPQVRQ